MERVRTARGRFGPDVISAAIWAGDAGSGLASRPAPPGGLSGPPQLCMVLPDELAPGLGIGLEHLDLLR